MSREALKWANEQRTGGPSAQIVLLLLADDANADGTIVRVDHADLAERSQQSQRTIFRRLKEFERAKVFSREITDRLENGAPVVSGRLYLDREWATTGGRKRGAVTP